MGIVSDDALEPGSVQALKLEWLNSIPYPLHLRGGKRDQVRVLSEIENVLCQGLWPKCLLLM